MEVRCNNCNWQGEEEDLLLIEFDINDETEIATATEEANGIVNRLSNRPKEVNFLKGCPNCKTDSFLMNV